MPWAVMNSACREAERLQQEEPEHFDAIVTEAVVAQPELKERDPLQLVTLWVYDQRVRS
jgi:hypothetical protein